MQKRILKLNFSISILLTAFFFTSAYGASPTLEAPNETRDGSFVLKMTNAEGIDSVEIFRNKDGGKYEKIVDAPCFKYISQVLLEDGVYGYKVRSKKRKEREVAAEFSQPIYISVNRDHKLMPQLDPDEARFSSAY